MKIVGAIFEKIKILNFFLMWTTFNFEGRSKTKKWAKDICKGTLDIECERDRPVGLSDEQKIKNNFSSLRDFFREKPIVSYCWVSKCTINLQNLIKIVGAIFEKIKIIFFLTWTTLNLGVGGKTKKGSRYFQEDPRYRIWTRSGEWFRPRVRKSGTLCHCTVT